MLLPGREGQPANRCAPSSTNSNAGSVIDKRDAITLIIERRIAKVFPAIVPALVHIGRCMFPIYKCDKGRVKTDRYGGDHCIRSTADY